MVQTKLDVNKLKYMYNSPHVIFIQLVPYFNKEFMF